MEDFKKVTKSVVFNLATDMKELAEAASYETGYAIHINHGVVNDHANTIIAAHQLAIDKAVRAATVRQVENWRDFIDGQPELKWLVKDMNEAIKAFSDPTRTDPNGVWLEAVAALSPNNLKENIQ